MNNDRLYRMSAAEEKLRIYATDCSQIARELCRLHQCNPHSGRIFAESLAATLLLSATLKVESDQNVSYRIQGNGKVNQIIVQADARGNIRGYISNPEQFAERGKDTIFDELIGAALVNVTKDLGFGEPYTGVSPLLYGSIARDTAYYLTNSEQVPSAIVIGTANDDKGIAKAGGILIQTFPDTPESSITKLEQSIASARESLSNHLDAGKDIRAYVRMLFDGSPVSELAATAIQNSCRCSREIIASTLARVDKEELKDMIEKDNGAEANCSFCKTTYRFSAEELQSFIDAREPEIPPQVH